MSVTRLQTDLQRAARELGLRVVAPYDFDLRPRLQIHAAALLPELGAPKGMIIFDRHEDLAGMSAELLEAGFGYSVLSDPAPSESYDLNSFIEMFSDWCWAGIDDTRPDWMR